MKASTWKFVVVYGVFLIVIGLLGFASNPEKAKTALMSGGLFGSLSIIWGVLMSKGFGWARYAAIVTTSLLSIVFAARAFIGWKAFIDGEPKLIAASLISSMLVASLILLPLILRKSPQP
jgi:uncharacterized membrane protein (UPF0136 family)